jgi:hypothetical protein
MAAVKIFSDKTGDLLNSSGVIPVLSVGRTRRLLELVLSSVTAGE